MKIRFTLALLLSTVMVATSTPVFAAQDGSCGDTHVPGLEPPSSNGKMTRKKWNELTSEAKDRFQQRHYNEPTGKNSKAFFDEHVRPKIGFSTQPTTSLGGVAVNEDETGPGELKAVAIFLSGFKATDKCLLECPAAAAKMMDVVLDHEFHNMPASVGGTGYEDDPVDDPKTKNEDESEGDTPIGEVANTWQTMKDACEAAGAAGNNDAGKCIKSSMCALYEELKKQVEGKAKGKQTGGDKPGYADEVKKHREEEEAHEEDPESNPAPTEFPEDFGDDPLPPLVGDKNESGEPGQEPVEPSEDRCELDIPDCPACEGEGGGDAGTAGSGSTGGGSNGG